jgi:uroporphyrinogen-III synthase
VSLSNLTVAVTGSRRGTELAHLIKAFGGIPYIVPTIGITDAQPMPHEVNIFINSILREKVDYFVFMTGPSIHYFFRIASNLGVKEELITVIRESTVISRSDKPSYILRTFGISTDLFPDESTEKGILKLLKSRDMKDKKIAIIWHGTSNRTFKMELESEGSTILELSSYSYSLSLDETADTILKQMGYKYLRPKIESILKLFNDIAGGLVHVITFTSPPSVLELMKVADIHNYRQSLLSSLNENVIVTSVGPSTTESLNRNGITVDVMPTVYKMGPMVKALSDYVSLHTKKSQQTPKLGKLMKDGKL